MDKIVEILHENIMDYSAGAHDRYVKIAKEIKKALSEPEVSQVVADELVEKLRDVLTNILDTENHRKMCELIKDINSLVVEDEWMREEGFCGTCSFFHREPRCQGGICGFYPDKPQMKLGDSCEEYETDKEWEKHFENSLVVEDEIDWEERCLAIEKKCFEWHAKYQALVVEDEVCPSCKGERTIHSGATFACPDCKPETDTEITKRVIEEYTGTPIAGDRIIDLNLFYDWLDKQE